MPAKRRFYTKLACVSAFVAVIFLLTTNSDTSISRGDESIHARVVQEMAFENGTYLTPRFFNNLYLNKPPLQFWISTPIVKAIGDRNFAYRVVPMLAGLGTCLMLLIFSSTLFVSIYPGLFAILTAMGGRQVLFDHGMRVATMDSMLLFLTTLSMFGLWKALTERDRKWILLTGLFVGLACLTKWVAGLVPWMVAAILLLTDSEARKTIVRNFPLWLLAGVISVAIPGALIGYHLLHEYDGTVQALRLNITERLLGQGFHNQDDTWLYFIALFKNSYGNFILLCFGLLGTVFLKDKMLSKLLFIWAVLPLVLYSALSSRLPWYYLPATPALWLLAGASAYTLTKKFRTLPVIFCLLTGTFATLLAHSLCENGKRVMALDKIPLDSAASSIAAQHTLSVAFSGFSPKVETSLNMSRRYLFYLNRMALTANSVRYLEDIPTEDSDVVVLPYSKLEDVKFSSFKSFLCPESDFKKPLDRICIFSHIAIPNLTPVGAFVPVGTDTQSRLGGVATFSQAGKEFGSVRNEIGNIGILLDPLSSRFGQMLSINAGIIGGISTVSFNGQPLGELKAGSRLQTTEFEVPVPLLTTGKNVISFKNTPDAVLSINWISLRPVR